MIDFYIFICYYIYKIKQRRANNGNRKADEGSAGTEMFKKSVQLLWWI